MVRLILNSFQSGDQLTRARTHPMFVYNTYRFVERNLKKFDGNFNGIVRNFNRLREAIIAWC